MEQSVIEIINALNNGGHVNAGGLKKLVKAGIIPISFTHKIEIHKTYKDLKKTGCSTMQAVTLIGDEYRCTDRHIFKSVKLIEKLSAE